METWVWRNIQRHIPELWAAARGSCGYTSPSIGHLFPTLPLHVARRYTTLCIIIYIPPYLSSFKSRFHSSAILSIVSALVRTVILHFTILIDLINVVVFHMYPSTAALHLLLLFKSSCRSFDCLNSLLLHPSLPHSAHPSPCPRQAPFVLSAFNLCCNHLSHSPPANF